VIPLRKNKHLPASGQSTSVRADSAVYVFHCCLPVIVITSPACHPECWAGAGRSFRRGSSLALRWRDELLNLRAAMVLPPSRPFFWCQRFGRTSMRWSKADSADASFNWRMDPV